jgi:hypothetical protein
MELPGNRGARDDFSAVMWDSTAPGARLSNGHSMRSRSGRQGRLFDWILRFQISRPHCPHTH